ncbi:MAG: hypothetical protein KAI47_11455, partial [Deltaproteobacteria bacterium]|nr:hypothetical protein [Deltaproteobacteria bacterium]
TDDTCVAGRCQYAIQSGFCLIDGTCKADGAHDGVCNVCDPSKDPKAWTPDASRCQDDGKSCTHAVCEAGTCAQAVTTGFCLIDGTCLKDGEAPQGDLCQRCDSKTAQDTLSPRADGTACAKDAIDCTDDICQSGACKHPLKANTCHIDNTCYAAGDRKTGSECAMCQPSKSESAWSNAPKGTTCTKDTYDCTDDVCDNGQCTHPTKGNACLINKTCYADGAADPKAECMACNPLVSHDTFTAKTSGQPCTDDKISCTNDVCQAGICNHPLKTTTCLISGTCYDGGVTNPKASCQHCDPSLHPGSWTQKKAGASCGADTLTCTNDICDTQGTCTHPLKTDACYINKTCYGVGAPSPTDSCSTCQPTTSTATFTPAANGTLCKDDGLPCTNDVCRTGTCKHELLANRCIINNGCYAIDAAVDSSGCQICAPSVSTTAATFAAGKACDDGDSQTALDTCQGTGCKGFTAFTISLLGTDTSTSIHAVSAFADGSAWIAGERTESSAAVTGFVAELHRTQGFTHITGGDKALYALSEHLAVGENGKAAYWDGTNWLVASDIQTHVGTARIRGVFGASVAGTRTFYLAGDSGTLSRCSTGDNGTSFSCQSVGSLAATTGLEAIHGLTNGATIGPLWTVRGETAEDIYYSASGTSWSTASPKGCLDQGTNACASTPGRLLAIWAKSAQEVWAVGEQGLILRFDGSAWKKVTIPNLSAQTPQSAFTFRSVYAQGDLVVFVGDRVRNGTDRDMIMMFYNSALDRFFAPQTAFTTPMTDTHQVSYRFNGVGGPSFDALYVVGSIWDTATNTQRGIYLAQP